jgi:hypothetical protein
MAAITPIEGGDSISVTTSRHKPFSEFKNIGFSLRTGQFGLLRNIPGGSYFRPRTYVLTGFFFLNGRSFGVNAHLSSIQ